MRIRLVFVCFGLFLLCAESPARGDSQGSIVRDSSLPGGAGWGEAVASGVDPSVGPGGGIPDYLITPELGEQHGDHLFHSFSHFGVGEGEIAQFTDNGIELGIERIVVRVTGGETSNVAGLIRSSIEGADFYLLNPDGIVFMETGGIDGHTTAWPEGDISQSFKGASFYLSTADQLKLGAAGDPDAGVFGVSNLEVPWSTGNCCTAGPTSFVFVGAAPAMIDVGSGYISRGGPIRNYAAMTVEAGQTFYAVAGEVSVTANLSNQQGSIV
ncbi:MAG: filamentous hemagglutinin N-terminal domain-containing protein, partial [Myxococcota bacterium]